MKNLKSIIALLVLTVFSVNLWGETYTKATSLKAGDEIVLVCEAKSMELTSISTTSTKYGIGTSYTTSVVGTYVFEVVAGSETNSFSFKTGSNYLRWNSGNSLDVVATSVAKNSSWSVTFDTDGNATIKNANDETRVIWWNVRYPRFACYTDMSDGNDYKYVQLYKKAPSTFSVTYNANGATSGTVPTDATAYTSGATVTVKGNTGNLVKMNKKFGGWNTNQSGTGTNYAENATFSITANTTLYAKWNDITFTDYITECSSDPSISVSTAELSGFTYIYSQGPSAAQTVTVNGFYLQNNVTVTAFDNYEICLSQDGTYTNTINLTPVDQMVNAPVYVRLKAGKNVDSYNGTLTVASSGLDSKNVTLSGSVSAQPLATPSVTATPAVHQITLSWNEVLNASSYQLIWNGGAPETVTSPVTKTDLTGGQSYSYSLVAVGSGNYTNSAADEGNATAGKETFTIKFFNSGTELTNLERNIEEGATFGTLPTLTESCDPKSTTFVGWTREEAWGGKVASFDNFVTSSTSVNAAMILNAVWAEEVVTPSTNYAKITSESNLTEGNYVIAYKYDDQSQFVLKNEKNGTYTTQMAGYVWEPTNDQYSNPDAAYIWKITPQNDGSYSIYNASVDKYVNATSATSGDGTVTLSATPSYFNLTYITNDSRWVVALKDGSDYCLHGYSSNPSYYFKVSTSPKTSNTKYKYRTHLYKQGTQQSTTNYLTTCSTDPLIEVSPASLTGFSTIATTGNPSAAQSFTVEGYNLTENISVSAPAGYEVSLAQASEYDASVQLPQAGGKVAKTTVYVRLAAATEANDNVTGNITLASSNTEQTIALTGKIIAKTLNSISIKTAPKTTYTIGDKFDPTGLVITATYNSGGEDVAYSGHEDEFTFNPTLETALTASDNKVTITWEGQSKDQLITMQCNVAWQVNGQPWTAGTPTTLVNVGSKISAMPTAPTSESCNGKTFMGWSATTVAKTDDKPTLLTKVADFSALSANTTYHAVFAKASEDVATTYTKVTDVSTLNAGDKIIITNADGSVGMKAYDGSANNFRTATVKVENNQITSIGEACEFVLGGSTDDWTFFDGTYYVYDAGTSSNNHMKGKTTCDNACKWKINYSDSKITVKSVSNTAKPDMRYNSSSTLFSCYNGGQSDIVLYCKPGTQYKEYSTTCTPVYDVNFFTNSGDAEPYATQKVEENQKAIAPATEPTKAGAEFGGWFTANDEALADKTITEATDFIAKWNYTAPTITKQPSGGEYTIGASVNLLVEAEPITGVTFTYQWQRLNGSTYEDIAGATNNYYTAPTNQESQNTYRCVVTNGDASTQSNGAQITVRPASYCAMPTIRIDELGEALAFIREATVTMECGNEGATIYYTLDGSDPKADGANPETYTAPFKIDATKTIEAYATATDLEPSNVQEKTFTKATLQSIAVETEPKKEYTALETFDPSNLVITATYNYDLSEEVEYNDASKNDFSFNPALTTPLNVSDKKVIIGWGGKETEQNITVNCIEIAAPDVEESKQGSTGITLTWSAIDHAASYQVKWNGGDAETPTYNTELSKYEFVKTGLTAYTPYTYEVIAIGNTNYCTSTTGVQNVTTSKKSCVSIDNAQIVKTPADFYVGESIEESQFKVDKHYDNGDVVTEAPSKAEIEGVTNPLTDAEVGTQTVTLTFNSKTTTIEITVKPQPVVTWSINGNEDNKQSFAYNAALVLPEAPAAPQSCAEKTFVGWTTENYKDHDSDEAPAVLFTEAGDRKVTEDVTYYAVFAMVNEVPDEVDVIDNAATIDKLGNTGTSTWVDGFTIEGSTGAKYYIRSMGTKDTDDALRFNGNGYFYATATAKSGKYLKSITINGASNKKFDIYASNSAYEAKPTSGSLKQITLANNTATYAFENNYQYIAVNGTESSSTITSVEIVYAGVNEYSAYSTKCAARTPEKIEITHEATKTFDVNDEFTSEGLEITASYNTGDPQVVTDYCTITAPDMTTAGEKDVNISYTENDVTVNTSYKINVRQPYNVMYEPNGATTGTVPSDTKKYYTGEKVTVLANESLVKTNNVFKGWSYAGATYQANDQITVGTENITLTAVWEEKMPCTITLSENGNTSTVTDKFTGDNYTLPAAITNNVTGYAFMGWSTQEIDDPVATTEQGTFFAKGEQITLIESAYTFYAVYARTSGTSSDYNAGKVTTSADIVAGGLYIFAIGDYAMNNTVESDAVQMTQNFAKTGLSSTDAIVFTLESATDGYYIKNNGGKYLLNGSKTNMSFSTYQTATTATAIWTFSYNTQKTSNAWQIQNTKNDDRFLGNPDASTHTIKAYSTSNWDTYPHAITIYRLVGGYTTAPTITVNGTTEQTVPTTFHGNVIVENVGAITLDEPTTWKNLTIKNGAKVTTKAALSINNLLIETKMGAGTGKTNSPNMKGACGQLIIGDGGSVTASGSAIIENQIDPTGTATQGWYSFSVPFPVSAQNGIYFGDAKLTNGVDYAIMEYLGDVRAQGQYGWKKYSGILQPGKMYVIAVTDSDFGKLRFKKTADGALVASNEWQAGIYGGGDDANWNAIGNPNLAIAQFVNNSGASTLQLYNHADNAFTTHLKGDLNIVVGSGFFIQAIADYPNITMKVAEGDRGYRAPVEDIEEMPFVAIQLLQGEAMSDQVFLNADVNATLSYEIGRDVAKFFMQGEAKCAQIYVPAYGTNLCVAQFPLNAYDETMFPLTITAPKEGTYTIAAENVPENVDLFLEQNGALIWNLSTSAYEINLNKGETKDYSIRWNAHSSSTPTGNNSIKSDAKVQKIFYQQNIYILQENQMYNAQGVKVQ